MSDQERHFSAPSAGGPTSGAPSEAQRSLLNGAPSEAQRSGFDGERRDSGAAKLSPQGEAGQRSSSPRVSRETSDIPPAPEGQAPDGGMGRDTGPDLPGEPPAGDPAPAGGKTTTPPPNPEPNRHSSVYGYLLVLFSAAFVLLLLAYFIQQRSNENAISGLRDSMNLSRAELMEEIDALKEKKAALEEELAQLQEERDGLEQQRDQLQEQWYEAASLSANQEKELQSWYRFWALEADYLAKDYEACAQFFQSIPADNVPYPGDQESVAERVDEILQFLLRRGYLTEEEASPFLPPEPSESQAPEQPG